MNKPSYQFRVSPNALIYEFDSISDARTIRKLVIYERLDDDLYHFGFGDLTESGVIDYQVVSDNNDTNTVLMTVVQTMLLFFERYPGKQLVFTGSTSSRSRLYRLLISKFLETIDPLFNVQGLMATGVQEPFQKNTNYQAFIISQRDEEI